MQMSVLTVMSMPAMVSIHTVTLVVAVSAVAVSPMCSVVAVVVMAAVVVVATSHAMALMVLTKGSEPAVRAGDAVADDCTDGGAGNAAIALAKL